MTAVRQLQRWSEGHGVTWVRVPVHDERLNCPFSDDLGVEWPTKTLFLSGEPNAGKIIHELGHILADEDPPGDSDEFRWLGWEIAVARKFRLFRRWNKGMAGYVVMNEEWQLLPAAQRRVVISARTAHAVELGLVINGEPQTVR